MAFCPFSFAFANPFSFPSIKTVFAQISASVQVGATTVAETIVLFVGFPV